MAIPEFDPDDGGGRGRPRPFPGPFPRPTPLPNPVSPRPTFPGNEEIELLSTADIGRPIPVAYGLHLVGGKVFFHHEIQTGTDSGKTLLFVALGVGEWNKNRALFVNGKLVDKSDTSQFHFHPGKAGEVGVETDPTTPNQKTCSFWPSNFTQQPNFPGIAYLSMKLNPDIEAPGPGFQVLGIYETLLVRIFDNVGNQTSYAFSSNPAWIALDEHIRSWIATAKTNGETLSTAEKDEIDFQAFKDWADDCDFVTPQGTKRWEAHFALTEETDLMRALELAHLLGRAYTLEKNGKIAAFMDKARSPVATVKAAHLHQGSFNLGRRSLRDAANRIEIKYRGLDTGKGPGTISTTGITVTGSGTDFTKLFRPGEPCDLRDGAQAGEVQAVKSVASATSMVLKTAFSVNQTGAAYGNPAQDFDIKTFIKEDTTLQGQVGRTITAIFDLGNSGTERAERIATFLLDRTTKLTRQTGYRLLLGQASALDHLAGDVLKSPDDLSFDPANTRDFEALEVIVQPDGSVEISGQEYQDIFLDTAAAVAGIEFSLPPHLLTGAVGGFQIGAVFVPDQLNGTSNVGEIDFDPLPDQDHTLWRLPDGTTFTFPAGSQFVSQAAQESYTGRVYVIFSKDLCNSVRGLSAFQDSHVLVLRWNSGVWQYDNNGGWASFTPVDSDICIFEVERSGSGWAGKPTGWVGHELIAHAVARERVAAGLTDAGDLTRDVVANRVIQTSILGGIVSVAKLSTATVDRIWISLAQRNAAVDADGNLLFKNVERSDGSGITSVNSTTFEDFLDMTKTITTNGKSVIVQLISIIRNNDSTLNGGIRFKLFRGGTQLGPNFNFHIIRGSANETTIIVTFLDLNPSAASHTYKAQWALNTAAIGPMVAPATDRVFEVVEFA